MDKAESFSINLSWSHHFSFITVCGRIDAERTILSLDFRSVTIAVLVSEQLQMRGRSRALTPPQQTECSLILVAHVACILSSVCVTALSTPAACVSDFDVVIMLVSTSYYTSFTSH